MGSAPATVARRSGSEQGFLTLYDLLMGTMRTLRDRSGKKHDGVSEC